MKRFGTLRGAAGQHVVIRCLLLSSYTQGQIESNYDETVDNFDSMDLKPELLRGKNMKYADTCIIRCS